MCRELHEVHMQPLPAQLLCSLHTDRQPPLCKPSVLYCLRSCLGCCNVVSAHKPGRKTDCSVAWLRLLLCWCRLPQSW